MILAIFHLDKIYKLPEFKLFYTSSQVDIVVLVLMRYLILFFLTQSPQRIVQRKYKL
jgi:hypothetical protein